VSPFFVCFQVLLRVNDLIPSFRNEEILHVEEQETFHRIMDRAFKAVLSRV
jgi:hypothetical protein